MSSKVLQMVDATDRSRVETLLDGVWYSVAGLRRQSNLSLSLDRITAIARKPSKPIEI